MGSIELGRPSPALVVSFLALLVALSGTAVALEKNSIGAKELKRNAVRSKQVKNRSLKGVDVKDDSLKGRHVKDDSLKGIDIDESTLDVGPPTGPAGGDLIGDYPNPELAADVVSAGEVLDGSLTGAEVADGGLTGDDIADGTLTAADLDANSVNSGEIVNGAVRAGELGPTMIRTKVVTVPIGSGGAFVNCLQGELRLSGGAFLPAGNNRGLQSSIPNGSNGWTTIIRNNSGASINVTAYVLCLRG